MILRALMFSVAALSLMAQQTVELASLRYVDTVQGTGAPAEPGKRLTVHYTGYLKDGTKFDSSVDRNEPFVFVQGRKQVITGWDIGFEGMKVGGKRRLIIPYQLAYGEKGSGRIPAKAELTFDVELLGVADTPVVKPSIDVLLPFDELAKRVMALARAVPDDKYGWHPASGGRSFADVFASIAGLNLAVARAIGQDTPALKALEKTKPFGSKGEAVAALADSFAQVRKDLEPARNGALSADADLFGKSTTVRGIFAALDVLLAEQLGYLEAYSAANGIPFTNFLDLNSSDNQ